MNSWAGRSTRRVKPARVALAVTVALSAATVSATLAGAGTGGRRPAKVVDVSDVEVTPVPAGNGVAQRSATAPTAIQPLPAGYQETEYLVKGNAALYTGPARGPVAVESRDNAYVSRILVRSPADPGDFSGAVWVEPFNTSGGADADAVWSAIAPFVAERGDAWVGVTVRAGSVAKLQEFDAARYADVSFAANGYGWDLLRVVGTLLKTNDPQSPLAELDVKRVYLGGYSQSGVDLATFVSAFHEVTRRRNGTPVHDGYLVGARGSNLSPLQSTGALIPSFERGRLRAVDVPVVDIEPQTDVEGFAIEAPTSLARESGIAGADKITTPTFVYTNPGGANARKADSNTARNRHVLLEIPGAPHATGGGTTACPGSSTFPTRYFTRAAAASVARWAERGVAPRSAPRIELATLDQISVAANDENGNALGGVRSPFVDVPLSRFEAHTPGVSCTGFGNETPLAIEILTDRHGDAASYMKEFTRSLDQTIKAGYLLELDRQTILDAQLARADQLFATP